MMAPGERQEGAGTEIVPASSPQGRPSKGILWYAGIALSVAVMVRYPMLGTICLALGVRTQAERFGLKGFASGAGIAFATLAAWAVAFGFEEMLFAIVLVGICLVVSALMWKRRASVLAISFVVVVATALSMAVDAFALAKLGLSLDTAMCAMLEEMTRTYAGQGVEANLMVATVTPVFETIWPIVYVTSALLNVAVAGLGSLMGGVPQVRPGTRMSPADAQAHIPHVSQFDAPMWAVGLLALSVLGIAVSTLPFSQSQLVETVSVTLLLSVRYIFTVQGLGVLFGVLDRWRMGCFTRAIVVAFAVSLETMFVLSIIGLVDVWANFRKLPRDGSHPEVQK